MQAKKIIDCIGEILKIWKHKIPKLIEEEMEKWTADQNQGEEFGYDTVVQHVTKRTQESKE